MESHMSSITHWPKDQPLFKFLKKEYADKLFDSGELLIGTLFDFRDQERHGVKRGDDGEGTKEIFEKLDLTIKEPASNPLSPFAKKYISIEDTAKNTTLQNCEITQLHKSDDCYIYCTLKSFDNRLYEEFQADVCIKIKKSYRFINAISMTLKKHAEFKCLSPCVYKERAQQYGNHDEYDPYIIKPTCYKNQKEVRAIWVPNQHQNNDFKPIRIKLHLKHVKRFCEIFHRKTVL